MQNLVSGSFASCNLVVLQIYLNELEEVSALVTGIAEQHLEHIFYNGLKHEMEAIKLKEPHGI